MIASTVMGCSWTILLLELIRLSERMWMWQCKSVTRNGKMSLINVQQCMEWLTRTKCLQCCCMDSYSYENSSILGQKSNLIWHICWLFPHFKFQISFSLALQNKTSPKMKFVPESSNVVQMFTTPRQAENVITTTLYLSSCCCQNNGQNSLFSLMGNPFLNKQWMGFVHVIWLIQRCLEAGASVRI